ncbi:MAG: hypothetical protein QOF61_1000 [Acidobacteriota bacterium]|nr:hypothetical protein [Acidobacteriota bacterium]
MRDARDGGGRVSVRVNSMGFRGEEFAREKTTRRVVVYGDSFIEAEFSPLEASFPVVLEKFLRDSTREPVEVINAGVVAYGTDQVSLRIEDEVNSLKPDLVVVAIYAGNDFGDLLRDKLFRLDADGKLASNPHTISPALREFFAARTRLRLVSAAGGVLSRAKAILSRRQRGGAESQPKRESYIEHVLALRRAEYQEFVLQGNNEVNNLFRDSYDADISTNADPDAALYKKRLMEQVVLRIKQTLDARGVPLILLVIPCSIDSCPSGELTVDRNIFKQYDPAALTNAVEEIATRHDITYLNLYEPFRANDPCSLHFKYPNGHWNERGQQLAADLLARLVVSNKLLEGSTMP